MHNKYNRSLLQHCIFYATVISFAACHLALYCSPPTIGNMLNVYSAQISYTIKIHALKDVKQRRVVYSYLRFDGSLSLFHLKMTAIGTFETSVIIY